MPQEFPQVTQQQIVAYLLYLVAIRRAIQNLGLAKDVDDHTLTVTILDVIFAYCGGTTVDKVEGGE